MTDTTAVGQWYDANAEREHERLGQFSMEFALSMRAIQRCIDTIRQERYGGLSALLKILDLGGGTGRYSVALAKQGHNVYYTDLSPAEVEHGKSYAASENVTLAAAKVVDALHVERHEDLYRANAFDIVLCMGPMYLLLESGEREKVIRDCAYMARDGGYVCVAFVTKWAHLRDLAIRDPGRVGRDGERAFYKKYVVKGVEDGRYDRVQGRTGWHVDNGRQAWDLVGKGGGGMLKVERVVGCEGFLGGGLSLGLGNGGGDGAEDGEVTFERWVDICEEVADREEMWGASDHLLVIAKKVQPDR